MECEHCGLLECDAMWSTKEHAVTFQKTVILNACVICVLIIHLSPSVLIGFHIAKRFFGLVLVTSVCRLLISPLVPINVVTSALLWKRLT